MTQLTAPAEGTVASRATGPHRRTLVALAVLFLVFFAAMMVTAGGDFEHDAKMADVVDYYDGISQTASQIGAYAGMVLVALTMVLGAAVHGSLRAARGSWLADVVFVGFAGLAATFATWVVLDAALWRAVDFGDESAIRSMVVLGDVAFLPLMASMIAIYVGAGVAGLTSGSLPKWLAVPSIVIGAIAPLGPLGFVGAVLLPIWALAVALTMRVER